MSFSLHWWGKGDLHSHTNICLNFISSCFRRTEIAFVRLSVEWKRHLPPMLFEMADHGLSKRLLRPWAAYWPSWQKDRSQVLCL